MGARQPPAPFNRILLSFKKSKSPEEKIVPPNL